MLVTTNCTASGIHAMQDGDVVYAVSLELETIANWETSAEDATANVAGGFIARRKPTRPTPILALIVVTFMVLNCSPLMRCGMQA